MAEHESRAEQGAELLAFTPPQTRDDVEQDADEPAPHVEFLGPGGGDTEASLAALGHFADDQDAAPASTQPLLSWIGSGGTGTSAAPMPTSLDPNAPRPSPAVDHGPLDKDTAKRITNAADAQRLLTSKDGDPTGELATRAVDLLLEIAPAQRGVVIDQMDDKAFQRMLERVPPDQRERFHGLLAGTKRADRKLHMWKEAHLSRARNDVERQKGDVGVDDPKTERTIDNWTSGLSKKDQAKADRKWKKEHRKELTPDADRARDKKRTQEQKDNLVYHQRHVARYEHTLAEVNDEVGDMYGNDGSLPELAQVDAMIERKEREYAIEKKTNLDLTNDIGGPDERKWQPEDLEIIDRTTQRLPREHLERPDGLHEISRTTHARGGVGGFHSGHRIGITDRGVDTTPTYGESGEKREGTSPEFDAKHGATIENLESVLTHEIGHDVAERNPAAFEAFKKAAGYRSYNRDELAADNMSAAEIDLLDSARKGGAIENNPGTERRYTPRFGTDEYWGIDHTALPYSGKHEKGSEADDWEYARQGPGEHFAELYDKAVHTPKQLHQDMVERPAAEAKAARARVSRLLTAMSDLPDTPANAQKLAKLQQELDQSLATMDEKQRTVEQRKGQFDVMRNDVFHTDKAASAARARLGLTLDEQRLAAFDDEAATLSTPEQIQALEERYRK